MGRLRRIAFDPTPLRVSRPFRRLWLGLLATSVGSQFTVVAVFIQVTRLTGDVVAVGATGLVWLAGLVAGTLLGAPILDRWDRRRVLIAAQLGLGVGTATLLAGSLAGDPPLVVIYAGLAVAAGFGALDSPTRSAMTPRFLEPELIPSAQALNQIVWNAAGLIGPALGGLVVTAAGLPWAYSIDLLTIGVMLVAAIGLPSVSPQEAFEGTTRREALREGFSFATRNRLIRSTFVIDLVAMILGSPRSLFTFLAVEQFMRGEEIVGILFAAPAAGALLGAATSGWARHVARQGLAVIVSVAAWGVAIAGVALAGDTLWLGLVCLAAAGWADVISAIFRSTILQVETPDRLRGRVSGIHFLVVTGGPRLGDLEAGLVAAWISPTFSVLVGGLACIGGAAIVGARYPELLKYRADARIEPPR
jgi:MFS family permease